MEKKVSKIKVFFCALLGYVVLNVVMNVLIAITNVIVGVIGFTFLNRIAFFYSLLAGAVVASVIGEKLLKTNDAERRYNFTIGVLLLICNLYFLVDFFRYGEGNLPHIISLIVMGIGYAASNKKEKEE